jgi:hypothetical protein
MKKLLMIVALLITSGGPTAFAYDPYQTADAAQSLADACYQMREYASNQGYTFTARGLERIYYASKTVVTAAKHGNQYQVQLAAARLEPQYYAVKQFILNIPDEQDRLFILGTLVDSINEVIIPVDPISPGVMVKKSTNGLISKQDELVMKLESKLKVLGGNGGAQNPSVIPQPNVPQIPQVPHIPQGPQVSPYPPQAYPPQPGFGTNNSYDQLDGDFYRNPKKPKY